MITRPAFFRKPGLVHLSTAASSTNRGHSFGLSPILNTKMPLQKLLAAFFPRRSIVYRLYGVSVSTTIREAVKLPVPVKTTWSPAS